MALDFSSLKNDINEKAKAALKSAGRAIRARLQTKGENLTSWLAVQDVQSSGADTVITMLFRGNLDKAISGQPAFIRCSIAWTFLKTDLANLDIVPPVRHFEIKALLLEAKIDSGAFETIIGAGFDETTNPPFEVARFVLRLKSLGLTFDAFLGGISKDGFELTIGELPICIPLGSTGLALTDFKASYAKNFAPNFTTAAHPLPLKNPTPKDYVEWSRTKFELCTEDTWHPLDVWQPLSGSEGIGVSCTVITLADQGKLLKFKDAGFLFLSPPTLAMVGGDGVLLDCSAAQLNLTSVIDFSSLSFYSNMTAKLRLPARDGSDFIVVAADGTLETYISFSNPWSSYFNLGTDKQPIAGSFFSNLFACSVYLMINSRSIRAGAKWGIQFGFNLGPIGGGCSMSIEGSGLIGWNPVQIFAAMAVSLGFSIKLWKFRFGIGLKLGAAISVPKPVQLQIYVEITLGLPWPLSDVTFHLDLLDIKPASTPPLIDSPLRLEVTLPDTAAPGAMHPLSGRQWTLGKDSIWPDAEIVIPFSLRPADKTGSGIIQPYAVEPLHEQGWNVSHEMTKLVIYKKHDDQSLEVVPNLRAVWTAGTDSKGTAMLHLPGDDPFAWWRVYDPAGMIAQSSRPRVIDQNFGFGANVAPLTDGTTFGEVVCHIDTLAPASLLNYYGMGDGRRTLQGKKFTFTFVASDGTRLSVDEVSVVFTAGDPSLSAPQGFNLTIKREIDVPGNPLHLWRGIFTLTSGGKFDTLAIDQQTRSALNLLSLRYRVVEQVTQTWTPKPILEPGNYRLSITGTSTGRHGGQPDVVSPWKEVKQDFVVGFPELLRPYIRYSTVGDSRIFSGLNESWNPTPHGVGFPLYSDYQGVIRFFTSYMDKIFPQLEIEIHEAVTRKLTVRPTPNVLNEILLPAQSKIWISRNGGTPQPDEELQVPSPWIRGRYSLGINFAGATGGVATRLDGWDFEISRFPNFQTHVNLLPFATISLAHGTEGTELGGGGQFVWPPTASVQMPTLSEDWTLPEAMASLSGVLDERTGLRYLQFAQRSRCTFGNSSDPLAGLVQVPRSSSLEVLLDEKQRPFCLWLRTVEPLDWRRVSGLLDVVVDSSLQPISTCSLDVSILPCPDGTSAFLTAVSNGRPVRLPKTNMRLTLNYSERIPNADGLPVLQRVAGATAVAQETWSASFHQPFGYEWSA